MTSPDDVMPEESMYETVTLNPKGAVLFIFNPHLTQEENVAGNHKDKSAEHLCHHCFAKGSAKS